MKGPATAEVSASTRVRARAASAPPAVVGAVLAVAAIAVHHIGFSGVLVVDEWQCSKDEVPVEFEGAGRDCFPEGSALPA